MVSLKIINSSKISEENLAEYIPRTITELSSIKETVIEIIDEVKNNGDQALINLTEKFDGVKLDKTNLQVSDDEFKSAYNNIDKKLLEALRYAKGNLIKFHRAQKREDWQIEIEKGVKAGQVYRPLKTVGLYIPGGRAIYPSTVLMTAVPAYVAGVNDIIICSPPQEDNKIAPEILVAAKLFEITKIFKVGGAQAIAAMALGTESIPKVQKIVGPGNKWVNSAKQLLSDVVAIDTPAGPSEILIIADSSADVNYVIIDFLSQIEHDPDNIGIILTDSSELIESIEKKIDSFVENSERKDIIKAAIEKNSLIIKATDIEECIRLCNIIAPEHLEILTKRPKEVLERINNAGAIFIGPYSPVPLGDYSAGTNHVLPTGGNALKYSGLNLYDFLKMIDVLECDLEGLKTLSKSASTIAEFEGLFAHKKSIEERLKNK
jgi:histidinol dehydrogenase